MKSLIIATIALGLASCVTTAEQKVWIRADGKSPAENPQFMQQYRIDSTVCLGQTQQTALGMAPIYYYGTGGLISAAIIQSERDQALVQVAEGCMAQRGYFHVAAPKLAPPAEAPKPAASPIAAASSAGTPVR